MGYYENRDNKSYKRRHTNKVYLFKSHGLGLIKIGIASNIVNRVLSLNFEIEDVENHFELVDFVQCEDSSSAKALENRLHVYFGSNKVVTQIRGAKTECFCISLLDEALKLLTDERVTSHYDPFIYVDDKVVHEVLGTGYVEYCRKYNIMAVVKQDRVQKAFRNLVANIIVNNGTYIYYNEGIVSTLSVECGITFKVFSEFIPSQTFIDFTFRSGYDIKFRMMHMDDKGLNFKKIRPDYLLKIYSFTKAELPERKQRVYRDRVLKYLNNLMSSDNNCRLEVK